MAIIQTVNKYEFRQAFYNFERQNQFSGAALEEIFDYLESYSEDTGEDVEFDVIAICCDFQELSIEDFVQEYSVYVEDEECSKEWCEAVENYLQDNAGWYSFVDDETVVFQIF